MKFSLIDFILDKLSKNKKEVYLRVKGRKYNITPEMAYEIADDDANLKNDFFKISNRRGISYMCFTEKAIKLVKIEDKKYWLIQILNGEISQIQYSKNETLCSDGNFTKNELKDLCCLIDVNDGTYIFYPRHKIKKRTEEN